MSNDNPPDTGVIKIGYLSFDASIKIHQSGRFTSTKTSKTGYGGIAGYIRHIDRGTDKRNGVEVGHSNPDINPDFTLLNESYIKDENGMWQETTKSGDMLGAINRRIDYAKEHGARIYTGGKNDSVLVRPLVIQLDTDSITGHEDSWMWDVIEILEEQFGKENITSFSIHKDETNVHMHIAFVPCHESEKNGKIKAVLSQTRFFQNPKQLAGIHKKMRKSLLDKGYEIEQENKPIDEILAGYTDKNGVFHQQGLTPDMLKALSEKEMSLKIGEIEMNIRKSEMDKLEMAVADVMARAKARQEEIEKEREILSVQQTAIDNDKATVQAQTQALIEEKLSVEKMKEEVYSIADVCNQILSDEKNLNAKFLEFLERESKRTGKPYQKLVEELYKRFQDERRDSVSGWQMEMLRMRNERLQGNSNTGYIPDIIDIGDTRMDCSPLI